MFPIKSSDAYIKENGKRSTIGAELGTGGSGSDIPAHTSADAGKVLTVNVDGGLVWSTSASSGNRYYKDNVTVDKNITAESEVL